MPILNRSLDLIERARSLSIVQYVQDKSGVFSIKFALGMTCCLYCVGIAMDVSRLISAKQKLQDNTDAAALYAAKLIYDGANSYQSKTRIMFEKNQPADMNLKELQIDNSAEVSVKVNSHVTLKPLFINIFDFPKLEVRSSSTAVIWEERATEIALVMDHTGSLEARDIYDDLVDGLDVFMDEIGPSDYLDDIYISFIPWASTVNVGAEHAGWINNYDPALFGGDDWHGCVEARHNGMDLTDTPPTSFDTRFEPYAWPSDSMNDWAGEPVSDYEDYRPYPDPGGHSVIGPNRGCSPEMVPLTNRKSNLLPAIREYQGSISAGATGTFSSVGMVWGYRALSSKWKGYWKGSTPSNFPSENGRKIAIVLSDGQAGWWKVHEPDRYSAFGYANENFLNVTKPRHFDTVKREMTSRFLEVCSNMKADGIEIITISYGADSGAAKMMEQCATSPSFYYESPGTPRISEIFSELAKEISQNSGPRIIN